MKTKPETDLQSSIAPERRDIERCLEGLSHVPKDRVLDKVNELNQRINSLQNSVKEQIPVQPSSVIRVCTWEVKCLADQLNLLRAQLVPKPKFRFKSRAMLTNYASSSTPSSSDTADSGSPSLLGIAVADSSMVVDDPSPPLIFIGQTGVHLSIDTHLAPSPMDVSPPSSPSRFVRDIHLTQLTECTVNLIPRSISLGNVYVKNLKRCLIVVPPIAGNILLHDCVGSTLIGACHQLQVHNSTTMDLYFRTTEDPVIHGEGDSVKIHPYPQEEVLNEDQLQLLFDGKENSISPAPIILKATPESDLN